MSSLWETARIAELVGLSESEHAGTFVLNVNEATIFSLDPAEDFEINTNVVQGWKILFIDDEHVFGELEYHKALAALRQYQLDEQDGSILIKAMSRGELEELLQS